MIKRILLSVLITWMTIPISFAQTIEKTDYQTLSFGDGGQIKMIYDRRQRPQSVFINNKVYMVYNGGASESADDKEKTYPFVISFNPDTKFLSPAIKLSTKGSADHHYCPIIWADNNKFLHILSGTHSTAGTHLISNRIDDIGKSAEDWSIAPRVRHSLSYPTVYNIYDNKKLMYFRTGEHRSSWTYLISADEGKSWAGPENDVVNLNMGGETKETNDVAGLEEWSSYQTCLPGKDGKFLHVAFCYYDDNKKSIPEKFYNPLYQTRKNLDLKYNLYYVKINLQTNEVKNFAGETILTPIDLNTANTKCKIWDTGWRGSGIPPDIIIDENENPAFLHILSGKTPDEFNYYYVRFTKSGWTQTVIAPSNHKWNSSYLKLDKKGVLHAYLITGNNNDKPEKGIMNSYGGGNIEEWCSYDKGSSWKKVQDLTPRSPEFNGWKFNNIQAVKDPKGNEKEGMFLFYGWKDGEAREAKAFLLYKIF